MEKIPRIDAHCHFFNLWYLISELLVTGRDAIFGVYPRGRASLALGAPRGFDPRLKSQIKESIEVLIRQIAQIAGAMFNDFEENYLLLRKQYLAVHPDASELQAYPLMMDIYYQFEGLLGAPETPALGLGAEDAAEKEFASWLGKERYFLLQELERKQAESFKTYRGIVADPLLLKLDEELTALFREAPGGGGPLQASSARGAAREIFLTPGFEREIRDSLALQAKYPGMIFPFLAVDPRREGIMSLVREPGAFPGCEGPLVSPDGPFYGIKLYPRLGYTPEDVDRIGLLSWCAEGDIPITVHTSTGGFPPLPRWKWAKNSDPALWKPILERYRGVKGGLRIDFAHFGNDDEGWRKQISEYATNKSGAYGGKVYADLSCYVKEKDLRAALGSLSGYPGLRDKLLFGTDFDVMMLTGSVDLQRYFRNFQRIVPEVADAALLESMMGSTPRAFLGAGRGIAAAPRRLLALERKAEAAPVRLGKEVRLGWLRDPPDVRDYTVFTERVSSRLLELNRRTPVRDLLTPLFGAVREALPPRVDLRSCCSPVENQKTLGSCTANAAVGLVEFFERKVSGRYIDASRLFLYKVTRKLLGWEGDTGAFIRTAMEALVLFGTPPEERFPYDVASFDTEPEPFAYAFAQNYKTLSYYRFDPPGTRPEELLLAIKTALAGECPLIFGFSVYDSMGEAEANRGRVPYPGRVDRLRGGHAVMAVGYDDGMEICGATAGSTPTRGALLFRNSWGEGWGEEGYGWLPYDYVLTGLAVDWWSIIKQEWVDTGAFR